MERKVSEPTATTKETTDTAMTDEQLKAAQDAGKVAMEHGTEIDALLEEIDDVLEENAETFVKQFIQKGGQ